MHLCSEILSLMLFPTLPPLAIVIIVIVHLMIIASLALPFYARLNPATPSSQSQQQFVSFWGGAGRGTKLRPLVERHPSSTFDCCLFVIHRFRCNSPPPGRIAMLPPPTRPPPPPPPPPPGVAPPSPPPCAVPVVLSHGGLLHS
jgi:hypothetical protein